MALYGHIVVLVVVLGTSCFGQTRFNDGPIEIRDVLRKAHVSGSIVYSGDCRTGSSRLSVPLYVHAPRNLGSPLEVLQDMFSGNSKMQLTQDPTGTIRMVEKDVPIDILDVKIHRITFPPRMSQTPQVNEPDRALLIILSSPEVLSFEKKHNISPPDFSVDGVERSDLPVVSGELNDITLSQALDYVLKTLPGYWLYYNCTIQDGRRKVDFRFY